MSYRLFGSMVVLICTPLLHVDAQNTIPIVRQAFHDKIDIAQKRILNLDKKSDALFTPSANGAVNMAATHAATISIDSLQNAIEANKDLDNNGKMKFLRGLEDLLNTFQYTYEMKAIKGGYLGELVVAYGQGIPYEMAGLSIVPVISDHRLEVGKILTRNFAYKDNPGLAGAHQLLVTKELEKYPARRISILSANLDYDKLDSTLFEIAKADPDEIYNYAKSGSPIGKRIRSSGNDLLKMIVALSDKLDGRQYFPFLDNLYHGSVTLDDITQKNANDVDYFKLLVATQIDYASRAMKRDTPMAMDALFAKLKLKARETFINPINGLHDNPNLAVRFEALKPLTPRELYYVAIAGEEELYTSSYLKGVYPGIFEKGGKNYSGDTLLMDVCFDHFKKWIKMAANYNTLDDFLKKMDKANSEMLMKQFVRNLDKKHGKDSLEDAVDVAGSFGSIKNPDVRKLVIKEVQANLQAAHEDGNAKARNIYQILNTLFLSSDTANGIDVSKELGIAPVYFMPKDQLENSKGRIIVQQFFYGDKGGQFDFQEFMRRFSSDGWKVTNAPEWTVVSSTKGTPISIYSNRPLDEQQGLDDKAQEALKDYLEKEELEPTVVIHRGHSYYLSSTIKQLAPTAKVVMLGSCGAFQSLNEVLRISPEAQIISSRQTGTQNVNISVITGILNTLREGKTLNWVEMWKDLSKKMAKDPEFADYVPPYDNLGAVFIMAYKKLQEAKDNVE